MVLSSCWPWARSVNEFNKTKTLPTQAEDACQASEKTRLSSHTWAEESRSIWLSLPSSFWVFLETHRGMSTTWGRGLRRTCEPSLTLGGNLVLQMALAAAKMWPVYFMTRLFLSDLQEDGGQRHAWIPALAEPSFRGREESGLRNSFD